MKSETFPFGLTVRDLKRVISDWHETDHMGEENYVWLETSEGLTNVVKAVRKLNHSDVLFECDL